MISTTVQEERSRNPGHTTREPQVVFELATNSIQLYVIPNLDKTSLLQSVNQSFAKLLFSNTYMTFFQFSEEAKMLVKSCNFNLVLNIS